MKHLNKIFLFGIIHFFFVSSSHAIITFERCYGGTDYDYCKSVVQTTDGGYILAGLTYSFGAGGSDVYLIRTDSLGDTLWTRTYGGSSYDLGQSVDQTSDGGYIIAGYTISYGAGEDDVYLIKTDTNGDTLWTRTYGSINDDRGESVAQTTDGGYIIAGKTESYSNGQRDLFLIKTDANGDTVWTKKWPSIGFYADCGYSVIQTSDGGYMAAGYTYSYGAGGANVYIVKTNTLGDTLWTRTYGGSRKDWALSVAQTTDGGYIVAGGTESYGADSGDVFLIKTDANGATLWTRTYGGSKRDWAYSVAQTIDGGYIIAGETWSYSAGFSDVYLIKTDSIGDTLWTRTYGSGDCDYGFSVAQTTDGGYILAGKRGSDVYLIKTDTLGNVSDTTTETTQPTLHCYPNPFSDGFIIEYLGAISDPTASLKIYDSCGRLIKSMPLRTNFLLLGYDLNEGIYFLKIKVGEYTKTKKLIKIR
ncbi:T9SS type A sorting domain-containing protein [candidate division WOR-3 bacterium]|nr:T9SS type A sorting domain-containing protein [candidate division WOR-3 bacterium]MCK4585345.1 T9SS type A sorting domain-containing protein [candidate division WOR-3 bacterium]